MYMGERLKKMIFYSSGKVSNIVELNLRIIDIGPYCYEDNNFLK